MQNEYGQCSTGYDFLENEFSVKFNYSFPYFQIKLIILIYYFFLLWDRRKNNNK